MRKLRTICRLATICLLTCLSGCLAPERIPYHASIASTASIEGFENIRMDADSRGTPSQVRSWLPVSRHKEVNYLVLSGGGAGGAFSVGALKAWSEKGQRPQFDIVSGVSTGALIAPYAFLGPAYDETLVDLYTSGVAEKLVDMDFLPLGLLGAGLLKQEPLRTMIERYLTRDIVAKIAAEHRKGRRLLVLTSNLDSQKAVIWNMGAIANSDRPDAVRLFRDIITASASIPGLYPAVLIKAKSGLQHFEEMHSDGGSASQILTIPEGWMADAENANWPRAANFNMYILVNNALMPEFATTTNNTFIVAARASSSLVKSQTRSALLATYAYSKKMGIRFHMASIDEEIPYDMTNPFSTTYMRAVYEIGYRKMIGNSLWKDRPYFTDAGSTADEHSARRGLTIKQ
ncbi:MAG: patatin-like phospholipase family protein [Chelatococcus sp.]|uniref:patatin-like phospholipase family protein n=1 Tax=Chelatococcus sp. TaxID=1953771 RepID=UPI0025C3609C|nr:patatin-like phospholipase family protein [Chelatococcus sp.]MBX3538437.1 patatin-like phospholipase family protein [Chelatococcus sp.]